MNSCSSKQIINRGDYKTLVLKECKDWDMDDAIFHEIKYLKKYKKDKNFKVVNIRDPAYRIKDVVLKPKTKKEIIDDKNKKSKRVKSIEQQRLEKIEYVKSWGDYEGLENCVLLYTDTGNALEINNMKYNTKNVMWKYRKWNMKEDMDYVWNILFLQDDVFL
tara:strand:- start:756 stop:1241 length:486 start_codon:yes stop_codon:yes gene_type:complete